jgi:mannitol/fructose-specific phosphotransferase system IIA component (Ntr-type)
MVTDKQKTVINMIENNLQIRFSGNTKEEARQFISENLERSKQATQQYRNDMLRIRLAEVRNEESMDEYFELGWYNMPH